MVPKEKKKKNFKDASYGWVTYDPPCNHIPASLYYSTASVRSRAVLAS